MAATKVTSETIRYKTKSDKTMTNNEPAAMPILLSKLQFICLTVLSLMVLGAKGASAQLTEDWAGLERCFRELPMEARRLTGPLFWLHGDESPEQLQVTLEKVREGGNGMFIAESRPHNDWLGPGWYRDLDICLQFARQHDLQMIIFDDCWWPSQMMGGRVPPQYGSKVLDASSTRVTGPGQLRQSGYGDENLISVVAGKPSAAVATAGGNAEIVDGDTLVNLTSRVEGGELVWDVPPGEWQIMKFTWKFKGAVGAQMPMVSVDGASPECVDWFIETVYQPHYDRYKEDFGDTIVGFFYDEPETQGDWGTDVPVLANERGVDLDKLMVAYKFQLAGEQQSAAYYEYLDLFAESWGRTMYGGISEWCRAHGVVSMGHFMEHRNDIFSRQMSGGNMMQLQTYSDMGGIDLVVHQVYPGERNMGVYQMPKIASSISHTYNKADDIALCEIYGGYDQRLTYANMKWLADWHHVRGVNLLNTHSFNPRAPYDRDYPPYFFNGGFEPRWPLYRVWADYTNRLSTILTGGHHVCPVAFLHIGQSIHVGEAVRPEAFTSTLQDALFDSDWLLYDAWENNAELDGDGIKLHEETYRILVVPPVERIPYATLSKAKAFFEQGGIVVGYDFLPSQSATVGKTSHDINAVCEAIWGQAEPGLSVCRTHSAGGRSYFLPENPTPDQVRQVLSGDAGIHPTLEVLDGETGNWLHVLHRVKQGRDVFFIANQHHDGPTKQFRLRARAAGTPEAWDAMRGEITALPYEQTVAGAVDFSLALEPMESVLVVFNAAKRDLPERLAPADIPERSVEVARLPSQPPRDVSSGIEEETMLEGCPWIWHAADPANVTPCKRYFRGLIDVSQGKTVAKATLRITADNDFVLYINGEEAGRGNGESEGWRQASDIDLAKWLGEGRNTLAIAAENFGDSPNPAGLIGRWLILFEDGSQSEGRIDTSWKSHDSAETGWQAPGFEDESWQPVQAIAQYGDGPWRAFESANQSMTLPPVTQADPFTGRVSVPQRWLEGRYRVCLEADIIPHESAAAVTVNGHRAGGFIGKPFRLDVTEYLQDGENTVQLAPFAPENLRLSLYANER